MSRLLPVHVPLRVANRPDPNDPQRLALGNGGWDSQNELLRQRDRQVELNVRMLLGNQHVLWNPVRGRYEEVEQWMTPSERMWRKRPVVNRLSPWFSETHAKVTENPPIVTFLPGPDQMDMEAAEAMDTIYKMVWHQAGMVDVNDLTWVWALAAGVGYQQSYVDLDRGELIPLMAQVMTPLLDVNGAISGEREMYSPIDAKGQVAMARTPEGGWKLLEGRMPKMVRQGMPGQRVHSPLEVRGEWNSSIPWHRKRVHMHRGFMTPTQFEAAYGIKDVKPDTTPGELGVGYELQRLLYGTGYFGAASNAVGSQVSALPSAFADASEGLIQVTTRWERPCNYEGMEETDSSPGGRLLIVTKDMVVTDGPRPIAYPYTSPFTEIGLMRIPGRPHDTTNLEFLVPLQQAYNRLVGQIMEHTALRANPAAVIDKGAGLSNVRVTNEAGKNYHANPRNGVKPIEFIEAPSLSLDVYKALELLDREIDRIGWLDLADPVPITSDTSGEAIKEQRFNVDRPLTPTMRRAAEAYGRIAENWKAMLPVIWPQETVLQYAGEDNIAQTIVVYPDLFAKTSVNVRADTESMLPEGRGERRQQTMTLWQAGAFGDPMAPEARDAVLELGRFSHPSRVAKVPGGIDRVMAGQFLGKLALGADPRELRWEPWYDPIIHRMVLERFMKGPGYLRLDEQAQMGLRMWWMMVNDFALEKEMQMAMSAATGLPPGVVAQQGGGGGGGGSGGAQDKSNVIPFPAAQRAPQGKKAAAMPNGQPSQ